MLIKTVRNTSARHRGNARHNRRGRRAATVADYAGGQGGGFRLQPHSHVTSPKNVWYALISLSLSLFLFPLSLSLSLSPSLLQLVQYWIPCSVFPSPQIWTKKERRTALSYDSFWKCKALVLNFDEQELSCHKSKEKQTSILRWPPRPHHWWLRGQRRLHWATGTAYVAEPHFHPGHRQEAAIILATATTTQQEQQKHHHPTTAATTTMQRMFRQLQNDTEIQTREGGRAWQITWVLDATSSCKDRQPEAYSLKIPHARLANQSCEAERQLCVCSSTRDYASKLTPSETALKMEAATKALAASASSGLVSKDLSKLFLQPSAKSLGREKPKSRGPTLAIFDRTHHPLKLSVMTHV